MLNSRIMLLYFYALKLQVDQTEKKIFRKSPVINERKEPGEKWKLMERIFNMEEY